MEALPPKRDEQYPLLKVDTGGGDGGIRPQISNGASSAWVITCKPPRSWFARWPEAMSACWMTFILLGMSFLVVYAMGIGVFRRNPMIIYKYNSSNPASDVFFHHIQQGYYIPFKLYSECLSTVATNYPDLRIHVYFLIDDSLQSVMRLRPRRLINRLVPFHPSFIYKPRSDFLDKDQPFHNLSETMKDFQKRHYNVEITVMNLSRYMDMTPLKYYWKNIPLSFLLFYARIFSVWKNSGVAIDLTSFNNRYNYNHAIDRKLGTILKQHNDGIKPEEYVNALNKMHESDDESELFGMLFGLINFIMNETRFLINNTFTEKSIGLDHHLIRSKQYYSNATYNDTMLNSVNTSATETTFMNTTFSNTTANISEIPQVALYYDISIISDGLGPSQLSSDTFQPAFRNSGYNRRNKHSKEATHILAIDPEGAFVSSSTRMHPLLRHLLYSACQGLPPRFAIQDTVTAMCPRAFRDDWYCSNIYFM